MNVTGSSPPKTLSVSQVQRASVLALHALLRLSCSLEGEDVAVERLATWHAQRTGVEEMTGSRVRFVEEDCSFEDAVRSSIQKINKYNYIAGHRV